MDDYQMFFPASSSLIESPPPSSIRPHTFRNFNGGGLLGLTKDKEIAVCQNDDVARSSAEELVKSGGQPARSTAENQAAESSSFVDEGSGDKNREGKFKKVRKPKYAFQTRSPVDILDDGYKWRKYGQKAVKNNKFPRSYYRCTHQGCGVKKQVQRLTRDEAVVVTTYEGVHSHPIEKPSENFEHILSQMQIYTPF